MSSHESPPGRSETTLLLPLFPISLVPLTSVTEHSLGGSFYR